MSANNGSHASRNLVELSVEINPKLISFGASALATPANTAQSASEHTIVLKKLRMIFIL
ncbi:hypothetical protein AGMMS50289_18590 [Betaproteobacteria bacterium]|nr:hypothetical protein AGMMS50289_18590 [Betaproteobacteria bacterium]